MRSEWIRLEGKGLASVWAPVSQGSSRVGVAGGWVGEVDGWVGVGEEVSVRRVRLFLFLHLPQLSFRVSWAVVVR